MRSLLELPRAGRGESELRVSVRILEPQELDNLRRALARAHRQPALPYLHRTADRTHLPAEPGVSSKGQPR